MTNLNIFLTQQAAIVPAHPADAGPAAAVAVPPALHPGELLLHAAAAQEEAGAVQQAVLAGEALVVPLAFRAP